MFLNLMYLCSRISFFSAAKSLSTSAADSSLTRFRDAVGDDAELLCEIAVLTASVAEGAVGTVAAVATNEAVDCPPPATATVGATKAPPATATEEVGIEFVDTNVAFPRTTELELDAPLPPTVVVVPLPGKLTADPDAPLPAGSTLVSDTHTVSTVPSVPESPLPAPTALLPVRSSAPALLKLALYASLAVPVMGVVRLPLEPLTLIPCGGGCCCCVAPNDNDNDEDC